MGTTGWANWTWPRPCSAWQPTVPVAFGRKRGGSGISEDHLKPGILGDEVDDVEQTGRGGDVVGHGEHAPVGGEGFHLAWFAAAVTSGQAGWFTSALACASS